MRRIIHKLMKISFRTWMSTALLSIGFSMHAQQEPMYSQYMFNMLNVNPAYAGNRAVDNITALHRTQWVSFPGHPTTTTISWDRRADASNVGYGLQLYRDKLGIESTVGVEGFYSYHLPFQRSSLALGLSFGALNYQADYSKSTVIDASDPLFQSNESVWLPTAGLGALYSTDDWYVGLSVPALLRTKKLFGSSNTAVTSGAANHYFLNGGYIFTLNESLKLKPSALLKYVSGSPLGMDLNLNAWLVEKFGLGVSYRLKDAIVAMAEFQATPQLRVGYSYDYSLTRLNQFSDGTHEIMLRYEFDLSKKSAGTKLLSPRYY